MKKLTCLIALLVLATAPLLAAEAIVVTKVIHETDSLYSVRLPSKKFIKITNFVQAGGASVEISPGVFSPELGSVVVFQGSAGLSGITVATAGGPNSTHEVLIAGLAVVNVLPVKGGTLFLSYLFGKND